MSSSRSRRLIVDEGEDDASPPAIPKHHFDVPPPSGDCASFAQEIPDTTPAATINYWPQEKALPYEKKKHVEVYSSTASVPGDVAPPIPRSFRQQPRDRHINMLSNLVPPGAFREGGSSLPDQDTTTTSQSGPSRADNAPPIIAAQLVQDPSIVAAVPHYEPSPNTPEPQSKWWSKKRNRVLLGALLALVVVLVAVTVALVVVASGGQSTSSSGIDGLEQESGPNQEPTPSPPSSLPLTPIPTPNLKTTITNLPTPISRPSFMPTKRPSGIPATAKPTPFPTLRPTSPPTPPPSQKGLTFPPTEPAECDEGDTSVVVELILDDRQMETTWELRGRKSVITMGGPYEESTRYVVSKTCLTGSSSSFSAIFAMLDSEGDGMCCNKGNGTYRFTINGKVFPTKQFTSGTQQTTPLIYPPAEPLACTNLNRVNVELVFNGSSSSSETSWELERDGAVVSSSDGPVSSGVASQRSQLCVSDGSYVFTIFDSAGNGLGGAYAVISNDEAIQTGEFSDGFEQSTAFVL